MTSTSVAIINQHAPFDASHGKEAQDLALIFGSYEQQVSMFFIGDGVYHLVQNQSPDQISAKDYLKTYAAFKFYDIEHIYVCSDSLAKRSLRPVFSIDNVSALSPQEMAEKIKQHKAVFTF
ncbi:sulfurtransferase complex subunit TusC [Thalassotalea atypica]|uniref:sulfurtransferase complex subunit TusC n=1 Tax=Thalassotalea atypica TaxID=2054316 RepID=UPI0025741696|nr:sulfurtransferase complex subunit TusC [Thalassotalea atypica]